MITFLYKKILKPILFKFDPEVVHDLFIDMGEKLGKSSLGRKLISKMYRYNGPDISTIVDGITYRYPIVLAAGFDYNGRISTVLDCMSFGGDEIGSVTARPCNGNSKPRLTRMIKSQSLIVYKGLKNEGADKIIARLQHLKNPEGFIRGISIAKTNDPQNIDSGSGIEDYFYTFKRMTEENIGDFYTINISCPNIHGGENFAEPDRLDNLLRKLFTLNTSKPVYTKMPINLPWDEFDKLLEVLARYPINGVVIGNLNKNYDDAKYREEAPKEYRGGLSGRPCFELSNNLIRKTKEKWGDRFTIIGCGGILSAGDAMEKLDSGADLLQLITGMIFEGPHLLKEICEAYYERQQKLNKVKISKHTAKTD